MKRILIVLFILLLSACNDNAEVEELKENYPEIKEVAEQFPESVQEKLAAPTVLPFEPENVALTYAERYARQPKEGYSSYGIYLWGWSWSKSSRYDLS
jgi:hypothetical protein